MLKRPGSSREARADGRGHRGPSLKCHMVVLGCRAERPDLLNDRLLRVARPVNQLRAADKSLSGHTREGVGSGLSWVVLH